MKARLNVSGPVNFGSGRKETEVELVNGKADVPVVADPNGAGKYQISFALCDPPASIGGSRDRLFTDEEILKEESDTEVVPLNTASAMRDQMFANSAKNTIASSVSGAARKVFLDWWKDYLEGMCSFEMLDGWITSPFHWPLKEDEVRAQTRTQITALTDGAKKKLIQRLKDKAKKLRDKAKDLRKAGQDQKAQMAEDQAQAMDTAANEVGNSMSPGKP